MNQIEILEQVQEFVARQHGHFINGQYYLDQKEPRIDITNPATEKVIATIAYGSATSVEIAAKNTQDTFKNVWSKMSPYERGLKLNKLADLIEVNAE